MSVKTCLHFNIIFQKLNEKLIKRLSWKIFWYDTWVTHVSPVFLKKNLYRLNINPYEGLSLDLRCMELFIRSAYMYLERFLCTNMHLFTAKYYFEPMLRLINSQMLYCKNIGRALFHCFSRWNCFKRSRQVKGMLWKLDLLL